MKKIAKYFFAALAVASAVSCAKELTDDYRPVDKVQQGESYTFTATMGDASKAVLDQDTFENLWMGDEDGNEYITVLEPAYFKNDTKVPSVAHTYVAGDIWEPVASAEFTAAEDKGILSKEIFAVYPKGEHTSFSGEEKIDGVEVYRRGINVVYPTVQTPTEGTYDPQAAVAVAYIEDVEAEQNLRFQNVSALLQLQIAENSGTVNTITISALGGEKLSGKITLQDIDGEGAIVPDADVVDDNGDVEKRAESYSYVTLEGKFVNGGTYYVAVAPAVLEQGIAIQFNNDEVQTYTISREIAIERGKIYELGVFGCDEPEDQWYLIGDYTVGNANTIRKTAFYPVEGEDMLVARNVNIREGQGFKVYNPSIGETFYPKVNALPVNEWYPLTKEVGYGYALATNETYDVYVDYVNKEMTGLILVEAGAGVPDFAVPENIQYSYNDGAITSVVEFSEDRLIVGYNYDEFAEASWLGPNADPSMEGKWAIDVEVEDYTVTPTSAMAGTITYTVNNGMWNRYYMIYYSNYSRGSIEFYSPMWITDENGNNIPVEEDPEAVYEGVDGAFAYKVTWNESDEYVEFAYPVPSGLFFYMSADYEKTYILDLGSEDGYTFRQGELFMDYEVPSGAEEFYNFFGVNGDPYCQVDNLGEVYQINPESNTTGVIYVKIGKNYYQLNYSNYEFNNAIKIDSPEDMEKQPVLDENGEQMEGGWPSAPLYCTGLGIEMSESAYVYPSESPAPRYMTYEIPAEMPSDYETPDGNAYVGQDDWGSDYLLDFGSVIAETIVKATNYNQLTGAEEGIPVDEMWWNPEYAGSWISQGEVFSDYTVMPTAADAGIITFVKEVTNMWGETNTQYFRIEYSDLTDESVKIFSPSQFDIPVYDSETGDLLMDEMYEMPYSWDGIGILATDEDYNSLPVEFSLYDEVPTIIIDDFSSMSPDDTQWVIYDNSLAMSLMGVELKALLNIGAADYSAYGVVKPGKYINFAYPVEMMGGPAGIYKYMHTQLLPNSEYEVVAGLEVEYEWGPATDWSAGYIVVKNASAGEGVDAETDEAALVIKYRNFNTNTGSCEFELSSFLPTSGGGMELLSEDEEAATTEKWFKAYKTPTKELIL